MSNNKMDLLEFGDRLLKTRDLDPLYVGLHEAELHPRQLSRWLLAYWCFYHVGAASYISQLEGDAYWCQMMAAAVNEHSPRIFNLPSDRWPRAAERRHFRGAACTKAVAWLSKEFPKPEDAVIGLVARATLRTDKELMAEVQKWPLFGPWISFKVADMLERVVRVPVKFDPNVGLLYREPRAGLELWAETCGAGAAIALEEHYGQLLTRYSEQLAPPALDRPCGPQEVETILCKWKSYMGGHYEVGKDIREHREALSGWGRTAERLLKAYPPLVT